MSIIYEPRGKAREYAERAVNLYTGCSHACRYCYCPSIMRQGLEEWARDPRPRAEVLRRLEREAQRATPELRQAEVLFCFMSDPYQSHESADVTRLALEIMANAGFQNVSILTKAGERASADFDLLKANGWKFGSTVMVDSEKLREYWEPGAPSIDSRYSAIEKAHEMGIETWVSVEPVVDPDEALKVMRSLRGVVTRWKVGKINHNREVEDSIDWADFLERAKAELRHENVYWKKDLLNAAQRKR